MSQVKLAKTQTEYDAEAILKYEKQCRRPFKMEELASYLLAQGWEVKLPSKHAMLTRRLKTRARELREIDAQKRKVRSMIAAKISKVDENGQMTFDVVWDHIHSMSLDHAVRAFKQRLDNHQKQDRALDRDIASFNDNNPNATEQNSKGTAFHV